VREVEEEVGLLVQVDRLTGIYSIPEQSDIVFAFTCTIQGGELTTSDEADQSITYALSEIPRNTSPKQVERIRDALNRYTEPVLKVQTGPSSIELLRQGKL
jgi:ADP-ribose pyrophosphatase YjhB (NUDIX family)